MNKVYLNESKIPSQNGAVVLLQTYPQTSNFKLTTIVVLIVFSITTLSFQLATTFASETGGPITSPLTSVITAPLTSTSIEPINPTSNSTSGNNSDGGSSGGSNTSPSCNDLKPKNAPFIYSVKSNAKNEVTLTWTKQSPTSNYLITYGLVANKPLYGAKIGDTDSFTIKGLSGSQTYFFRVKALNGCNASDFSNEVSFKASGAKITQPAKGFSSQVLSANTLKPVQAQTTQAKIPAVNVNINLFEKITNLINGSFKFLTNPFNK